MSAGCFEERGGGWGTRAAVTEKTVVWKRRRSEMDSSKRRWANEDWGACRLGEKNDRLIPGRTVDMKMS